MLIAPAVSLFGGADRDGTDLVEITIMGPLPTRGSLVLGEGEQLFLDQDMTYSSIVLGAGSSLYLDNCTINVVGSGAESPKVVGAPSTFSIANSTLVVRGLNGSGLIRDRGDDASISLDISSSFRCFRSYVRVYAGDGWEDEDPGYYLKEDVGGYRFAGGNATFEISMDGGVLDMIQSSMRLYGGDGGDAPDAQDLTSDAIYLSGGYTTGGNVTDHVGSGGRSSLVLDCPGVNGRMIDTHLEISPGAGGDAGDAGGIPYLGDQKLSYPVPPGGYTTSWIENGTITPMGEVRGSVGVGGNANMKVEMGSLLMDDLSLRLLGGSGGDAGDGGDCRADDPPEWHTAYTIAGGGGGGYAGGMGGGKYGSPGGDILGRVGAGGNCSLNITCSEWMQGNSLDLDMVAGDGGVPGDGGLGGGMNQLPNVFDGGGGGGGGFSGGAGCGELFTSSPGPGAPGEVGREVGRGGNLSADVTATYLMASGWLQIDETAGSSISHSLMDGGDGEVGADGSTIGGPGGTAALGGEVDGSINSTWDLPGPVPMHPRKGEPVQDVSIMFNWHDGVEAFWSHIVGYEFRLLSSPDPTDVVLSGLTDVPEYQLPSDPGDGLFYWVVRCRESGMNSSWSLPREIYLDRRAPEMIPGPEVQWVPLSDPQGRITIRDDISGPNEETLQYRVDVVGGSVGMWQDGGAITAFGDLYNVTVPLPGEELDLLVWVRISDRAGNGPSVFGPLDMRIDGTPPLLWNVTPEGWVKDSFTVGFNCLDNRSGPSDKLYLEFENVVNGTVITRMEDLLEPEGSRYEVEQALSPGMWRYRVSLQDMVGNLALSGWQELSIDVEAPTLFQLSPANGTWANTTTPEFSFEAFDDLSGVVELRIVVEGSLETFEEAIEPGNVSLPFSFSFPLQEGWYGWKITSTDAAGNIGEAGPWEFGIDVTGPHISNMGPSGDPPGGEVDLYWDQVDPLSGAASVRLQRLIPGAMGWSVREELTINDTGSSVSIAYPFQTDDPMVFWRLRGVDGVGNLGPWSDVVRMDVRAVTGSVSAEGGVLGEIDEVSLLLESPYGIDPSTVSYRIVIGDMVGDWSTDVSLEAVSSGVLDRTDSVEGVRVARLLVPVAESISSLDVEVRWRDGLPLAVNYVRGSASFVFDLDPPLVEVFYGEVVSYNPTTVVIRASDELSGVPIGGISVWMDEWRGIDEPSGPMLIGQEGENITLLLNLTWGAWTDVAIRVEDGVGNVFSGSYRMKASRPPELSIGGGPSGGEIELGEELVLYANVMDPDGEPCEILWMVDGEEAGNGTMLSLDLPVGEHTVVLRVDDGHFVNETVYTITVVEPVEPDEEERSFFLLFVLIGSAAFLLFIVVAILIFARKRSGDDNVYVISKGSTDEEESTASCSICMRRISKTSRQAECRCGSTFHRSCGMNEGECPDCGREIMISREE
ncbi:MAG: E3 ubiquitin protein ligase [Thermoplasmata archaeon]|nr:E3 ubiquitin protein ligase [Thermoplasmata archaeon]